MYSIIDIETTGNSALNGGKITEVAIYNHNGVEIIDSFSTLINPEINIPWYITNLTGIDNSMVADAPKFYQVAKKIVEMTAGNIFVAHNVNFDYQFIKQEFKSLGYEYNRNKLCTVQLSRKIIPGHRSYSLGKLCDDLNIKIDGRHRAAGDALATVQLFELLMKTKNESEPNLFSSI
ncbi:3'-5' exonuclease [Prolixibacteraceae bacterium JC049]|jgi:DNA polymerase-3 subunit epsilon|nr:3'-5' exonuclease [Prolixibacteraceae bacterium JC049]